MKGISCYIITVFVAFLFFALNSSLPMVMDDEAYAYNIGVQGSRFKVQGFGPHNAVLDQQIEGLGDVWESQKNHYADDNGRLPVHMIVQSFCGIFGKNAFDVVNTVMFAALICLLPLVIFKSQNGFGWKIFVPITLAMLLLSEPKVWYNGVSHSVNYLWSSVACLGAIVLLNKNYKDCSSIIKIFLLPLFVLAGWSHECMAIGISAGFLYRIWADRHKMSKWQVAYGVAFWLGCVLLVFAPSNFARMAEETSSGNRLMVPVKMVYHLLPCLIVLGTEAVLLWRKSLLGQAVKDNLFWIVAAVTAMAFVVVSGVATRRSLYGAEIFLVIIIVRIFGEVYTLHHWNLERLGKVCACLMIILLLICLSIPEIIHQMKL